MKIKLLSAAKSDIKKGYYFYENQASGLGDYFLDSIYNDIDSLLQYHGIHPIKFGDYYCKLSEHFPFAIYYRINHDLILVDAVLDCRQNPEKTEKRLQ